MRWIADMTVSMSLKLHSVSVTSSVTQNHWRPRLIRRLPAAQPPSSTHSNDDLSLRSNELLEANLQVQSIATNILKCVGTNYIPYETMWMIYDPWITTQWNNSGTASRFQRFLTKRRAHEKAAARIKRHARAERRRKLVSSHWDDEKGEMVTQVVNMFVDGLLQELRVAHHVQEEDDVWEVVLGSKSFGGLYAKWCPTPGGMHDKALGLCTLIRERLLQRLGEGENSCLREELLRSTAQRLHKDSIPLEHVSLQRDVLTPLRRLVEIPEHFIGATRGRGVNYTRMPSRCRLLFGQKVFRKLDKENYDQFLVDAAKANLLRRIQCLSDVSAKVNVNAIAPHEAMLKAMRAKSVADTLEAGLQWQALVESCKPSDGRLIIPMCDVSGSMSCRCGGQSDATCMDVAMALSLLLTDTLPASNAFHGKVLTFSEEPDFVDVKNEEVEVDIESIRSASSLEEISGLMPALANRVVKLRGSNWGMSTNFFFAAQRICDVIEEHNLTVEEVQGLEIVVFSDMEFNEAQRDGYSDQSTMLENIRQLFVERFGDDIRPPKIVFWNLRASVTGSGIVESADENGVALLSGMSSGLLQKYLSWDVDMVAPVDGEDEHQDEVGLNPMKAMLACLEDPLYDTLRLEDDLLDWEVLVSDEEIRSRAEMVIGENGALAHASNSSALVAFFFEAVPGIQIDVLEKLIEAAFQENPRVALKLLFNLGSVRKNTGGKGDRDNFQAGLLWLFRKWPQTYLLNMERIAAFTSLKEVLNSAMFIMYEGCENDTDDYALFSLKGQRESLQEHQNRKICRDDRTRRHKRKKDRLSLWIDFARGEGRELFGDLRVQNDWEYLQEKLCIENRDATDEETDEDELSECSMEEPVMDDCLEIKEYISNKREVRLARKKKTRMQGPSKTKRGHQNMHHRGIVDTQLDFVVT